MKSRRQFVFILGTFALTTLMTSAHSESATRKMSRIGFVWTSSRPASLEAFKEELAKLGDIDGLDYSVEIKHAESLDRIPRLVEDQIRSGIDLIVADNNVSIMAAKKASQKVPIVMMSTVDPVAAGYVNSLARPGGNVTGLALQMRDLSAKRVELLKELLPKMSRIGVLWDSAGPGPLVAFKAYTSAAQVLGISLQSLEVRGPTPDFTGAFKLAVKTHTDALVVVSNPLIIQHRAKIVELANMNRIPTMYETSFGALSGGILSYGANTLDTYRRAANYVHRIIKGAKPGDLPIEQPTKFELLVNLKTAKAIGLTIPQAFLLRVDEVIE